MNRDVTTIAGELSSALSKVVRRPIELTGAGRTDAGVHAWGQVVHIDLPPVTDLVHLQHRVNSICAPEIVVRQAEWVAPDFDARFSACWRHYRYTVLNTLTPHPFMAATSWHVPALLNIPAMQLACDPLIGEHDFSTFCRRAKIRSGEPDRSLVRRVHFARWSEQSPGVLLFEIRANAFCHQMVRSIVGTLVDVGRERFRSADVSAMLRERNRAVAGTVAPPHGLSLWEVGYGENSPLT